MLRYTCVNCFIVVHLVQYYISMEEIFETQRVLMNDLPLKFLIEVGARTVVMFIIVLLTLKFTGKRGVRQLSIFEVVIIISLGSAAGDPMFYEDVGMLPALMVFITILVMYRLVTWLLAKSRAFEDFIEGKVECVIEEGQFSLQTSNRDELAQDEFFAELRVLSVEHIGQVKYAYLETNGSMSVYYYEDDEVKYGMPIRPQLFNEKSKTITKAGIYACTFCANTEKLQPTSAKCKVCNNEEWVEAIKTRRIS